MSQRTDLPTSRHHLVLYDEDWEFLVRHYGEGAHPSRRIGAGPACREIIHSKVLSIRANQMMALDRHWNHLDEALSSSDDKEIAVGRTNGKDRSMEDF